MMSSLRQSFIKETVSFGGKGRGICLFYQLDIIGAADYQLLLDVRGRSSKYSSVTASLTWDS